MFVNSVTNLFSYFTVGITLQCFLLMEKVMIYFVLVPGPVLNLTALSNDSTSIFVSWDKPINLPFCIHQYAVVYCHDEFFCSKILTQVSVI